MATAKGKPAGGRNTGAGGDTTRKMQEDRHSRDYLLFHEYFHGETGAGLGASHQTGWTGLIAKLLQPRAVEAAGPPREPAAGAGPADDGDNPARPDVHIST